MSSTNGNHGSERDFSIARAAAAERLAKSIVGGFDLCGQAGIPLSQVQKIAVVQAALLEFDGFEAQVSSLARIADLLHVLGVNGQED
jgi:hypothetical protein